MSDPLVPGYAELCEYIASAVRLHNFAEKVIAYVFEENPAALQYEIRAEIARHISDMVADEIKSDASRLVMFASAILRKYPPPPMEEEEGGA